MKVEKETDRAENPGCCDECGQEGVKLNRWTSYGPGHQVEWLCKYCSSSFNKGTSESKSLASMLHVLEKSLKEIKQ